MKKSTFIILFTCIVNNIVYAGGKGVEPVREPVEPVPELQSVIPIYLGLGGVWGKYDGTCGSEDCPYEDVTYGALFRAGYDFNQYLGVEARVLGTFFKDDKLGGQELRHYGLYLKPMYPVAEEFNLYGLLGYGLTKTKVNNMKSGNLIEIDENGFSAGLGLEFDFSKNSDERDDDTKYSREFDGQGDQEKGWGLFVDYQRLLIKSDTPKLDTVSAGVTYDF